MPLPPEEIGRRIKEVRIEVGFSPAQLAAILGVQPIVIEQLESGILSPVPGDYILILAQALKTDFRYFISRSLDDVETGIKKLFRALAAPNPKDFLALRRFMSFAAAEHDLEILLGCPKPSPPPVYRFEKNILHKDQGKQAAQAERKRLGLGNEPISNIFDLMRRQGIGLMRQRLEDGNLSGVTLLHPRAGVCALINYDDDLFRQFFSAAHEYCHVLFERGVLDRESCIVSYYNNRELGRRDSTQTPQSERESHWIELRANNFASEFLLPLSALDRYPKPQTTDDVAELTLRIGRDYRINTVTVAIRLKDKGWISQKTLESFKKVMPKRIPRSEKRDPEVPLGLTQQQYERRQVATEYGTSSYYLELLRRAVSSNLITMGRFTEMLDMTPRQAASFAVETGIAL
ncbi:XRE family transcriptional regulator [Myxococcus faecalis]|uniref:helix-turn-helix domain-containing protein n=1 Tax=Myxococcus faecalis TaxID=3115646 RepID=UPI003CEB1E80